MGAQAQLPLESTGSIQARVFGSILDLLMDMHELDGHERWLKAAEDQHVQALEASHALGRDLFDVRAIGQVANPETQDRVTAVQQTDRKDASAEDLDGLDTDSPEYHFGDAARRVGMDCRIEGVPEGPADRLLNPLLAEDRQLMAQVAWENPNVI